MSGFNFSLPDGLEIKESPIHGLGVFATKDFPAHICLGEFVGVYMKHAEFKRLYGNDIRYCYRKRRTWEYRVAKDPRNFITYINDGTKGFPISQVNCYLKNWHLYTSQFIQAGQELFLKYERAYNW